jgi:hypothetical protein
LNNKIITNIESGEKIQIQISGITANLLYATDGYAYDLRYWRVDER